MQIVKLLLSFALFHRVLSFSILRSYKNIDTKTLEIASIIWDRLDNLKTSTLSREQRLFIKTAAIMGGVGSKEDLDLPPLWPVSSRRSIRDKNKYIQQAIGQGMALAYFNFVKDVVNLTYLKDEIYQVQQMWEDVKNILEHAMKVSSSFRHKELNWLINNYLEFYKYRADRVNIQLATGGDIVSSVESLVEIQTEVHKLMLEYMNLLRQKRNVVKELTRWGIQAVPEPKISEVPKLEVNKSAITSFLKKDNILALLRLKKISAYHIFPTLSFCAIANIVFTAKDLCNTNLFAAVTTQQADILKELSKQFG